jgi:hypothetical protein
MISDKFLSSGYVALVHITTVPRALGIIESKFLHTGDLAPPKDASLAAYRGQVFFDLASHLNFDRLVTVVFDLTVLDHYPFHLSPKGYYAGRYKRGDLAHFDTEERIDQFLRENRPPLGELVVYSSVSLNFFKRIELPEHEKREAFRTGLILRNIHSINGQPSDDFVWPK